MGSVGNRAVFFTDSVGAGYNNNNRSYIDYLREWGVFDQIDRFCQMGQCFGPYSLIQPAGMDAFTLLSSNSQARTAVQNADYVFIQYGGNDAEAIAANMMNSRNGMKIGTPDDDLQTSAKTSVCGYVNGVIYYIKDLNPNAKIIALESYISRDDSDRWAECYQYYYQNFESSVPTYVSNGTIIAASEAFREKVHGGIYAWEDYNIPMIALSRELDNSFISLSHLGPDRLHPNESGHEMIATRIKTFLEAGHYDSDEYQTFSGNALPSTPTEPDDPVNPPSGSVTQDSRIIPDRYNTGLLTDKSSLTQPTSNLISALCPGNSAVIEGKIFNNGIVIDSIDTSKKIVFKNCYFENEAPYIIDVSATKPSGYNNTTIYWWLHPEIEFEDCEFCRGYSCVTPVLYLAYRRCKFHNMAADCFKNEVYAYDCYVYDIGSGVTGNMMGIDGLPVHADGIQGTNGENIILSNVRFEIPWCENHLPNCSLFFKHTQADTSLVLDVQNVITNGGNYDFNIEKSGGGTVTGSVQFERGSSAWKAMNNTVSGVALDIKDINKVYVGSVWKDGNKAYLSVTNDTAGARNFTIKTASKEYTRSIGAMAMPTRGTGESGETITVPPTTAFADLPIDVVYEVDISSSDEWIQVYDGGTLVRTQYFANSTIPNTPSDDKPTQPDVPIIPDEPPTGDEYMKLYNEQHFYDIANAIRQNDSAMTGKTFKPSEMAAKIVETKNNRYNAGVAYGMAQSGSTIPEGYMPTPTANKIISANGTNIDVLNYATVTVNVPSSVPDGWVPAPAGTKIIEANGTGIDVREYAFVNVNVPSSGIPEGWVKPEGNLHITANNDLPLDVSGIATITVAVPTGGSEPTVKTGSISVTTSEDGFDLTFSEGLPDLFVLETADINLFDYDYSQDIAFDPTTGSIFYLMPVSGSQTSLEAVILFAEGNTVNITVGNITVGSKGWSWGSYKAKSFTYKAYWY